MDEMTLNWKEVCLVGCICGCNASLKMFGSHNELIQI